VEKETIPTGSFKKKVKAGADIAAAGTVLYATKGNKSNEFWMYTPPAFAAAPMPGREGVEASALGVHRSSFIVSPNPAAGGFATVSFTGALEHLTTGPLSLAVFDVSGRCVGVWKPLLRNGAADLDLRHLTSGVYLVRLDAAGFSATQKFVVQR
jgi:hypothetical protein